MNLERPKDASGSSRPDFDFIVGLIPEGARVLDVGCGEGALLRRLKEEKRVAGRGIELDQLKVNLCVASGLSVIQGDADSDLAQFPDQVYDYVILSQTLQATRAPKEVLRSLLRIGKQVIVSIPNFGQWRYRLQLLIGGKMPVGGQLPFAWYETPNIHLCTIHDFIGLVDELDARVISAKALRADGRELTMRTHARTLNLLAEQAIFLLKNNKNS